MLLNKMVHGRLLIYLINGKKPIGSKWVYHVKYKSIAEVDRYKTRLVAKGYNQIKELDYKDCFSPVAKLVMVHLLVASLAYPSG